MVKNLFVWLSFYVNTIYLGLIGLSLKLFQPRLSVATSIFWSMALQSLQNLSLSPIGRFTSSQQYIDASYENALGIFSRFSNQARSSQAPERQDCSRILIDVVRILDDFGEEEHFEKFFQIICELGQDEVLQVRGALLEKYPNLFSECRKSSHLNPYVDRYLTPCLTSQLNSVEMIRKAALDVIGILLEQRLFSEDSLKHMLVPTLFLTLEVPLETDERLQQYSLYAEEIPLETCTVICRVVSMQCINDRDWIFQNFVPKFSTFLRRHSSAFQLRKAAIQIFGQLADLFGEGFVESFLVPHLVALAQDDAWGVRKAICEIFVDVASLSNSRLRKEVLVPVYLRLLDDKIRWVANMAAQELGRFISTFADHAFTGLSVHNGKVVEMPRTDSPVKEENQKYADLPTGCYMPENDLNSSSLYQQAESFDDTTLLLFDKLNNRRSNFNLSVAALGRCSSSDNLSKVGIDFDNALSRYDDENLEFDDSDPFNCTMDMSYNGENLDETPPGNNPTSSAVLFKPPSPGQLNYWQTSFSLSESDLLSFGILTPFGTSPKAEHEENVNRVETSTAVTDSPLTNTFSEASQSDEQKSNVGAETKLHTDVVEMDISNDDSSTDDGVEVAASTSEQLDVAINTMDVFGKNTSCQEDTTMDFSESLESSTMEFSASTSSASTFTEMEGSNMIGDRMSIATFASQNVSLYNDTMSLFPNNRTAENTSFPINLDQSSLEEQKLKEAIPMELIRWFIKEVDDESDADYNKHRARTFPAVALTLGKRHWEILRRTYLRLVNDNELVVRALLAASLHDLATIVGPEITLTDLVPAFNRFREDEEEVRQNLLLNLYEFVERVPEQGRIDLLQNLPHMLRTDNNINWRFRKDFAIECGKLCALYSLDDVNRGISGIALTLCSDRIDEVRDEAAKLTARILGMMVQAELGNEDETLSDTKYAKAFVEDIVRGYAHSRVAKKRITFSAICKYLLTEGFITKEQFAAFLLDPLLELATDKVGNVRYSLCQVLLLIGTVSSAETVTKIKETLLKLEKDLDGDVSRAARRILEQDDQAYAAEMVKPIDVTTRRFHLSEREEEYFATLAEHMERVRGNNTENSSTA